MKIAFLTTDNRDMSKDYDTPAPHFGPAPAAVLQGFEGSPDLEVHVVTCLRHPAPAPAKIGPNIYYHSLVVRRLGWMRTLYSGCVRAIYAKLREIQPDLVHGQGTERECAMGAVLSSFPNVLTLHGVMKEMASTFRAGPGSFYWLAAKLERFALGRTLGVMCNSQFTLSHVKGRNAKTWMMPNPLREPFFAEPEVKPARGPRPVVLNIGNVCVYKRQLELLDVAEQLHHEGIDCEFRFFGSAPSSSAYAAQFLKRVQQVPNCSYQGMRSGAQLMAEMDGAAAMAHVSSVESFGLVVAEALARNLKFFGFKVGGVPDVAEGVEMAELLPDADWQGLKRALTRWVAAGAPRPVSASSVMRERYHPKVIAARHLEVYREVLGGTKSGSQPRLMERS